MKLTLIFSLLLTAEREKKRERDIQSLNSETITLHFVKHSISGSGSA